MVNQPTQPGQPQPKPGDPNFPGDRPDQDKDKNR